MKTIWIIILILLFAGFVIGGIYYNNKETQKLKDFYEEWCPKLNSTMLEQREGYSYHGKCIRESEGVIRYFWISEINGEYKLVEDSR